jgi:hypothetical protein
MKRLKIVKTGREGRLNACQNILEFSQERGQELVLTGRVSDGSASTEGAAVGLRFINELSYFNNGG